MSNTVRDILVMLALSVILLNLNALRQQLSGTNCTLDRIANAVEVLKKDTHQ